MKENVGGTSGLKKNYTVNLEVLGGKKRLQFPAIFRLYMSMNYTT